MYIVTVQAGCVSDGWFASYVQVKSAIVWTRLQMLVFIPSSSIIISAVL